MSKADSLREQAVMIAAHRVAGKTWPEIAKDLERANISVSANEIRAWWPRIGRGLSPAEVLLEAANETAPLKTMARDFSSMQDLLAKALNRIDDLRADRDRLSAQIGHRATLPPKMDSVEIKRTRDELETARAEIDRLRKSLTASKNDLDFVKQQIFRLKALPFLETVVVHCMSIFPSSPDPMKDALDLVETTTKLAQWATGDSPQDKPAANQPARKRGFDLSKLDNFIPKIDLNFADDE